MPGVQSRIEALRQAETDLAALDEARRDTQLAGRRLRLAEMDDRLERLAQLAPAIGAYEVAQRDLAQARQAREQAQAEVDAQAALERANADLSDAEEHVRASETLVRQANLRDILTYWVRLKEVEQLRSGNEQMAEYASERDDLAARAEMLQRRQFTAAMVVVICAVLQVIGIAIGFRFLSTNLGFLSWGIALIAFLVMWAFVIAYFVTMYRRRRTDARLRVAERKLTLSSIRSEAANLIGGAVEDLPRWRMICARLTWLCQRPSRRGVRSWTGLSPSSQPRLASLRTVSATQWCAPNARGERRRSRRRG